MHLKLVDVFQYLAKTIVVAVVDDTITAILEALFDWHTEGGPLTGGDMVTLLVGKELSFSPKLV